MFVVKN
jgi:hypothetical protein